jgi:sec-independent protein translocase protein TatC
VSESDDHHPDEPVADDALPPKPGREKAMGFWDHLEELRWTIIKSAIVFALFVGGIAYFLKDFNSVMLEPLRALQLEYPGRNIQLITLKVTEPFTIIIQLCAFGGLALSLPFILIFIGQFVAPALTEKEMKAVLPMAISAMLLFIGGSIFSYYLLVPSTLRMAVELNVLLGFGENWSAGAYYSMLTWLVFGVGLSFEFPLVIILLVWLGIMTTAFLRKYRRHAIVVIFIIAALVTPTPDFLVQTIFAAPLYVLYEVAIIVSSRIEKRRAKQLAS